MIALQQPGVTKSHNGGSRIMVQTATVSVHVYQSLTQTEMTGKNIHNSIHPFIHFVMVDYCHSSQPKADLHNSNNTNKDQ